MTIPLDKSVICPVLIGRTHELAALYSLIDAGKSEQDHAALISGEAGIGKSRLVAEARSYAVAQGFLLLQVSCFQADTSYPYASLLDLLRAFFANQISVFLTANQEQIVNELVRLLHLARHRLSQPLFFLFTYRSEETSPGLNHWLAQLDGERLVLELALKRLSRTEVGAMLQAIFAAPHPIPADLSEIVYTLTEGNPFFVEEMLKSLMTTGELQYANGTWEFRSEERNSNAFSFIPRSVQDAVKQQADQLSAEAKQALSLAAVAGRRFDFSLLQLVLRCDEDQLLPLMQELIAAQLVIEESSDQFAFRHALIRQAIYSELLARERRSLHRTIAEALETLYITPSLREAYLADLAYHFYEAGIWTKALEYEQRIGEKAVALYAPRAAIEHLTHALNATNHLHVMPPSTVYYARGQAYETLGDFDRALSDYEHALDTAHTTSDGTMEWQNMMALGFLWAERDYAQAGVWFRQALDQASRQASPILRARSLNRLGNWLVNTGRIEEGLQAHQEALGMFEEQHNIQGMAATLDLLGITYGMRGDRIKAVELLGQAIDLFRTLGDNQSLISSLAMRAVQSMPGSSETTVCPLRTRDECVQDASESLHLARQIDSLAGQVYMLLLATGLAISELEAGLSLAQELGSTFWIATLAAHLGQACVLNHNLSAAHAALQEVHVDEQIPRTMAERDIALTWGELLLAQREPDKALQIVEQLLASAPGLLPDQSIQPIPHLLKLKGEALMALSQLDEAVKALEDAKLGAVARNARPVLWTIHRSLGQAYQLLQRKDQARLERAAGRQLIEDLARTIDDTSLRETARHAFGGLTPREHEVAALIAQGKTSREIAELLVVSERTAEGHVSNILGKLGFTSRAQIAAWIVERGLAKH